MKMVGKQNKNDHLQVSSELNYIHCVTKNAQTLKRYNPSSKL